MPCRAGKPPSDEGKGCSRPHPRSACPRVITCGQGPLASRRGSLLLCGPWPHVMRLRPGRPRMRTLRWPSFALARFRLLRALTGARLVSAALTRHAGSFSSVTGAGFRSGALTRATTRSARRSGPMRVSAPNLWLGCPHSRMAPVVTSGRPYGSEGAPCLCLEPHSWWSARPARTSFSLTPKTRQSWMACAQAGHTLTEPWVRRIRGGRAVRGGLRACVLFRRR
jgi:hypothetical protein